MRRTIILAGLVLGLVAFGAAFASSAKADSVGPITFEPTQLPRGRHQRPDGLDEDRAVRREGGRQRPLPGRRDVQVRRVRAPPVGCRHERQLRRPDVHARSRRAGRRVAAEDALQRDVLDRHDARPPQQPGLHMSVSPDNGSGARMSYLRFEDQADGVHVFFDDVTNPGPVGTVSNFSDTDIATLSRDEGALDPLLDHVQDAVPATTSSGSTSTATRRSGARRGRTTTATTPSRLG